MTVSVSESEARCLENRRLLAGSRFLIARSRRLLNPAWVIAGASDGIDLHVTVRERLASGWLFPASHKVWAGGHICVVCGTTIAPSEVENEVVGPTTVWAHLPCYPIWREESRAYELANSANGPDGTDGSQHLADLRRRCRSSLARSMTCRAATQTAFGSQIARARSDVCSKPIFAAEVQEVFGAPQARAHLVCYRAWLLESIASRQVDEQSSAESNDTAAS